METGIDWKSEEREIIRIGADIGTAKSILAKEEEEIKQATRICEQAVHAQEILQLCAQAVQQQVHTRICQVVTSCLQTVFGEGTYEFHIRFEKKRGKTEANLVLLREGVEFDPLNSTGGGVVDVVAFALRMSCLCLHRPRLSKVLVLDEPMKNVSEVYQENVKLMMVGLAKDMKVQMIIVTHNPIYEAGDIITI